MASFSASAHTHCSLPVVEIHDADEDSKHKVLVGAGSLSSGHFAADTSLGLLDRVLGTSSVDRDGPAVNSGASSWVHHDQDLDIRFVVERHGWDWKSTWASVGYNFVESPCKAHLIAAAP